MKARYSIGGLVALALFLLSIALWGCSSAPPAQWLLYSRATYLYGRIEALAEVACQRPTPEMQAVCAEGAKTQQEIKTINPMVQAELAKKEPDWTLIMQYTDLVIGAAGKFLLLPK